MLALGARNPEWLGDVEDEGWIEGFNNLYAGGPENLPLLRTENEGAVPWVGFGVAVNPREAPEWGRPLAYQAVRAVPSSEVELLASLCIEGEDGEAALGALLWAYNLALSAWRTLDTYLKAEYNIAIGDPELLWVMDWL